MTSASRPGALSPLGEGAGVSAGTDAASTEATVPSTRALAAYGLLGLPLAMAALPVYVQAPSYYSSGLGLPLALTGAVLFGARLIDTVQDPWIGQALGHLARAGRLRPALWLAALVLALAFAGLWLPPVRGGWLAAWLALMLVLAYSAHSVLQIAHLAWGARLGDAATLGRAAAWREGLGVLGVITASTLGVWLLQATNTAVTLPAYALLFAGLLALGLVLLLHRAPPWRGAPDAHASHWRAAWATPGFRRLLLPFFLNALSVAIPATLVLFFIDDRLQASAWAGALLGLYFLAAAASLPWWTGRARRHGLLRSWRLGMVLAVLGFATTPWLGPDTVWIFALVCLATGWAVGADLVLPPLLLARRIPAGAQPTGYYGLSSLLGKLALASAALALPLLALLGYTPSDTASAQSNTLMLALVYAVLPALCKLAALVSLPRPDAEDQAVDSPPLLEPLP